MPVLATMTAIALLRGGGDDPAPFFDPEELREMLTDGLEGIADDELQRSLAIADELESVIERYRISVQGSLDAYVEELSDPNTDAADLIERLAPLDRERNRLMKTIIDIRQHLLSLLGDELWDAVF